jgi:hypothetical protein
MTDVIVIYPNNNFVIINKVQNLKEFQGLIGGYIQQVTLDHKERPGLMYIDQEGIGKKLPENSLACAFHMNSVSISDGPVEFVVAGPAIIMGPGPFVSSYTESQMATLLELREKFGLYPKCDNVYSDIIDAVPDDIQNNIVTD